MKTKHIILTAFIYFLGIVPATAQSEPGPFDGLQNTLNEFADVASDAYDYLAEAYNEQVRLGMLAQSDIRMMMKAKFDEESIRALPYGYATLFNSHTTARETSMYAEFDWQNMAEMIDARSSESTITANLGPISGTSTNEAERSIMYVDGGGYWYVPTDQYGYVQVNLQNQMQRVANTLELSLDLAIEAGVTEMMDQLALMALIDWNIFGGSPVPEMPFELLQMLQDPDIDVTGELLRELLEQQMQNHFQLLGNLPPFIHFAMVISPTLARAHFNVSEQTVTYRGEPNCTKMTVLSGDDAGYISIFDQYGRLIHLRDTDDATADYWYDRDVTVNIPQSVRFPGLFD